ncbi:MAG: 4,5-dihydroxyphthalate decarboxylase [Thermoleophilaceae bacterium]|nr:4,5-dihydroxyphthalate decarboxylase [Thermoleophilaceae bacterium]
MPALPLTLACWDYDRTRALMDGTVTPEGVELTYLSLMMPESFFRMSRFGEFHASEMSLSWYSRTALDEPRPFVAIPVFPSRMFRHGSVFVNAHSGIREPVDLQGRKVGCPEYQMTAAVWIKGILDEHHGVPFDSVTYHTGGLEEPGRRERPFQAPEGVEVVRIPDDRTLSDMLDSGEIDALYSAQTPSCFLEGSPNVRRLFEDFREVEKDYFRRTGIFPIMHTVVVRTDVHERHPWVALSLAKAFELAKSRAEDDLNCNVALKIMLPWLIADVEEAREALGAEDYWPYGFDRNRETLATFLRYAHAQGLTGRLLEPEELFAPSTLETAKT